MTDDKILQIAGASTSQVPLFHMIPRSALVRLANRFELGIEKHGADNWRNGIQSKEYQLNRLSHIIDHALKLKEKLQGHAEDDGDDDAAAIMWGACVLIEAQERAKKR